MDWFWVFVVGGLAFWFHSRVQALEGRLAELSADHEGLLYRWNAAGQEVPQAREPETHPRDPEITQEAEEPASNPSEEPEIQAFEEQVQEPAESKPLEQPKPAAPAKGKLIQSWPERPATTSYAATESYAEDPATYRRGFDFEDIFGRLLPIWGGGIALAIAGFFLVRWSIENGLLNEYVRVAMGFAFGLGLVGAAEIAHRFSEKLADPRVRQALSGAGIATLYASFYLAGAQYGLIGPALAFAGMAGVTALAIVLSFRFGLPSAVLGLVGGFATPVLAGGSEPNLPVLATYLALVTGGLTYTGEKQDRPWLSIAALAGGLGWGAVMLATGAPGDGDIIAIGGYLVMVGTLLPSLMGQGALGTIGRIVAAGLAVLQIAALVTASGYALLAWGMYLLVAAALAVLGWRSHRLREASAVAAGLGVCLLAAWPSPEAGWFWTVTAACMVLFAALPLAHIWREDAAIVDWGKLAAFPLLLVGALCLQFGAVPIDYPDVTIALVALALAALPAAGAWLRWPSGEDFSPQSYCAFAASLALVWLAGMLSAPAWSAPLVTAAVAGIGFALVRGKSDLVVHAQSWVSALIGLAVLLGTGESHEFGQLIYYRPSQPEWLYALRWFGAAAPFALIALMQVRTNSQRLADIGTCLLGYGAAAMLVPASWMPVTLFAAITLLAWRAPERASPQSVLLGLATLWAIFPVGLWLLESTAALAGEPVLASNLPELSDLVTYVVPLLAALIAGMLLQAKLLLKIPEATLIAISTLALVIIHTAFKSMFGIADLDGFAVYGLAERTVWQALLAGAGIALVRTAGETAWRNWLGYGLGLAALAHFTVFSLLLHNPLLTQQSVGAWPLTNLLLPAYGIAIGTLVWLRTVPQAIVAQARPAFDGAIMVLVALLALSMLRQIFAGTILLDPAVGSSEDLLRSLLAILLALGYLGWGAWKEQRSWRIGSLVLMLGAVAKVFLFDTAGLEGLARIASFMALGLCLIGIGWFYTKQLKGPQRADEMA